MRRWKAQTRSCLKSGSFGARKVCRSRLHSMQSDDGHCWSLVVLGDCPISAKVDLLRGSAPRGDRDEERGGRNLHERRETGKLKAPPVSFLLLVDL